jgi:hypothetical protein
MISALEEQIVLHYPQVKSVNILEHDGWHWNKGELTMQIFFYEDDWILLERVEFDKIIDLYNPQYIRIEACNNYTVRAYRRTESGCWDRFTGILNFALGRKIDTPLDNLDDILKNYVAILNFYNNLIDIPFDYAMIYGIPDEFTDFVEDRNGDIWFRIPRDVLPYDTIR